MDKICLLVIVLFAFIQCSKDKTPLPPKAKEEFAFLGKDSLLVGTWQWDYSYTKVKHYFDGNISSAIYLHFAKVGNDLFNSAHKMEIKKNGAVTFYENDLMTKDIYITNTHFFKQIDENDLYVLYSYNSQEAFLSFFIFYENDSLKIKTDHSFLNFPVGSCLNDHQPVSHNYFKIE